MRRFHGGILVVGDLSDTPRNDPLDPSPFEEDDAPGEEDRGLALTRLCLELPDTLEASHREVDEFLRRHREHLGLLREGSLLSQFLDRVWPEGVPTTLIISNIGSEAQHPKWLLRPVSWGPTAQDCSAAHQTLAMHVYRRQSRLVVKQFEVTPHVPPKQHEWVLSAPLFWNPSQLWMVGPELDALGRLPLHRAITRKRLESWRQYLDWKELLIKKHQIKVPYLAWRWANETCLEFLVKGSELGNRRLLHQELCVAPKEEEEAEKEGGNDRKPPRRRRDAEPVQLGEVENVGGVTPRDERARQKWEPSLELEDSRLILIRLEEDHAERFRLKESLLPRQGLLVSEIAKELSPLANQKNAINRLQNSQGFCPRIADFLFESKGAGVPVEAPPPLEPLPGSRELNPGQIDAVQKALAAPDLCLIQGPPGTGKTTVIAELCLRMAHQGKRVLIASQTNLAVDNALSRLTDKPDIRPLRLGDPERVDEDFRELLADNVVARWFSTIAEHSRERMEETSRLEQELASAQGLLDSLRTAQGGHARSQEALAPLRQRHRELVGERELFTARASDARQRKEHAHQQADLFQSLQQWARGTAELPAIPEGLPLPELAPLVHEALTRLSQEDPVRHMEGLPLLATLQSRTASLEPLRKLLADGRRRCAGGNSVSADSELAGLLAEHQLLATSEDPAEAVQLAELNKRINKLRKGEWSQFTLQLSQRASAVLARASSPAVDELASALSPSTALLSAIDVLDRIVQGALGAAEHLAQALPSLAQAFGDKAGREQSWEEQAARELSKTEAELARRIQEHELLSEQQRAAQQESDEALREWNEAWGQLAPPQSPPPPAPSVEALREASSQHQQRHLETEAQLERRRRWREVQQEWCGRLRNVSESDRNHLQALYTQHANVVGMTCNEAGKKKIFQAPGFKPFDMVIIDEVSKATPTELIMPMLLGQTVVLVGDHRQLPPMFREKEATFSEANAEGEISQEDFKKYQRMVTASLFQELFEAAPESLKAMLWVQYRMHPQVMDAVNQFYGGKLEPGARPNVQDRRKALGELRQHHLQIPDRAGGRFLTPHQHLLWVDSSWEAQQRPHWEAQVGTSKANRLEVKLVLETLRQLNAALRARGYGRKETFHVERADDGQPLRAFIQKRLAHLPESTLQDLFEEKRVRLEGRSQKPERPVQLGEKFHVDARRQVGVLTFYGAQLREIRQAIEKEEPGFDAMELKTNTVDRFQGMERPIVIASLVRSKSGAMGDFVRQYQRINVGLSRAQELLIVIGAAETFKRASIELPPLAGGKPEQVEVYKKIFEIAVNAGGRRYAWQLLG